MLKWVKSLHSGDYKQGKFHLRNHRDEFCCLGVLCNLHAQEHPEIAKTEYNNKYYLGHCTLLPNKVRHWAGLSSGMGRFYDIFEREKSLTKLNDDGVEFSELADIIENNYTRL